MTTITIPVGAQPIIKDLEDRPVVRVAGAAIAVMDPVYLKSSDSKYYTADSDPTDSETSVVVGIAVTKAGAADDKIAYCFKQGQVIDFNSGGLTPGANFWLSGSIITDSYADITSTHFVTKLGYANESGEFVLAIINQLEVK
jgi:hypothetical protein